MKRPSPHSEVGQTEESRFSGLHLLLVKRWWHKADYFIVSQAWWEKRERNLIRIAKDIPHVRKSAMIVKVLSSYIKKKTTKF